MRQLHVVAVAAAIIFASSVLPADAMSKQQERGFEKCTAWCQANNKTAKSRNQCWFRCMDYWSTHSAIDPSDPSDKPMATMGQ